MTLTLADRGEAIPLSWTRFYRRGDAIRWRRNSMDGYLLSFLRLFCCHYFFHTALRSAFSFVRFDFLLFSTMVSTSLALRSSSPPSLISSCSVCVACAALFVSRLVRHLMWFLTLSSTDPPFLSLSALPRSRRNPAPRFASTC